MSGISVARATAERATAEALKALPPRDWMIFQDVRWPGRRRTTIDHIAIGPGGVFCIDTGARGRFAVSDAVKAAAQIAGLIASVPRVRVTPVFCMARRESWSGAAREVTVCTTENVAATLAARPGVLAPEQVRLVTLELDIVLREALAG